jgi:hypothetical protein
MDVATQRLERRRADHRCEYCRLPQYAAPFLTFHIEHIQSRQHIQDDSIDNLALANPESLTAEAVPCITALFMLPFFGPRIDRIIRIFSPFFLIRAIRAIRLPDATRC